MQYEVRTKVQTGVLSSESTSIYCIENASRLILHEAHGSFENVLGNAILRKSKEMNEFKATRLLSTHVGIFPATGREMENLRIFHSILT